MKTWGLLLFISCFSVQVLADECGGLGSAPGEYLVRWKQAPAPSLLSSKSTPAFKVKKWIYSTPSTGLLTKIFSQTETMAAPLSLHENLRSSDVEELKNNSDVLSVEPNCYRNLTMMPNDPMYRYQWGFQTAEVEAAWDRSVGTQKIIVAVSDTGVDYNHEDLHEQMWVNTSELNGRTGIDDDGNGCVDDIYGCDLANGDGDPMPSNDGMAFHGTHVAGIIGAKSNNSKGIAGVAWNVKIMAAKGFADQTMGGTLSALLSSIYYSANNGARIINCSWGGPGAPSQAERDAIRFARNKGILVVVAAGNDGVNASGFTPAAIAEAFTVGSININSTYSHFSNYGTMLDILAPGGEMINGSISNPIYSTMPNNGYGPEVGTSMAAPFVSGVAALVLSVNSTLSLSQLENILLQSATPVTLAHPNNPTQNFSHKIINAKRAVEMAMATLPQSENPEPGICDPTQGQTCSLDLSSRADPGQGKMAGCGQVQSAPKLPNAKYGFMLMMLLFLPLGLFFQLFLHRHN